MRLLEDNSDTVSECCCWKGIGRDVVAGRAGRNVDWKERWFRTLLLLIVLIDAVVVDSSNRRCCWTLIGRVGSGWGLEGTSLMDGDWKGWIRMGIGRQLERDAVAGR